MDAPDRPISLRDLARRLELSPMVVSAILRERDGGTVRYQESRVAEVTAGAQIHGYRPNNDIGLIVPRSRDTATLIQYELMDGVVEHVAATQAGKGRVISEHPEPGEVPDLIREWQVGGVIVVGEAGSETILSETMEAKGIAYALVNPYGQPDSDAVLCDDAAGARRVVDAFAERGCRRAVLMLPRIEHHAGAMRIAAFRARCAERELEAHVIETQRFAEASDELLAVARTPAPSGLFTLAEWWLAASSLLTADPTVDRDHWKGIALRNTPTPWSHQPQQLRLPYAAMGRAAVDMIYRKWALREASQPNVILEPTLS